MIKISLANEEYRQNIISKDSSKNDQNLSFVYNEKSSCIIYFINFNNFFFL